MISVDNKLISVHGKIYHSILSNIINRSRFISLYNNILSLEDKFPSFNDIILSTEDRSISMDDNVYH